ncbi:tetratricopeptide repeat protein [Pseudohalioglobus lutimaris]|nr:tetratricopeptide repeat protein [Pseudohalioglobus lutimaris]
MSISTLRLCAATLCAALIWAGPLGAQNQGQYRSRIQLDPLGEMGKGSEMSVSELEAQIDQIKDPYARSSAGRFLARHSVQEGDYEGAIRYYREALGSKGLSDVANRQMLRELAQVYLLNEDFRQAAITLERALDIKLQPEPADFLLLAQARYRLGDYVAVVVALDGISAAGLQLDRRQLGQALALYYRAGAYQQCEHILRQLLQLEPENPQHWHQLATVYLQQNKRRDALDQLSLALEKQVPFTGPELQLLIDLRADGGNPYSAAVLLQEAMVQGSLDNNAANQRKLFELWLRARERDKAIAALQEAARSSGDTELYLYLAQLQMEDQQWQAMLATVLASCSQSLDDRYVSRANLLLGVSLFKQGREEEARRAFINATLVGGANEQAAQWLQFMDAAPATEQELRQVRGPCYGSAGKKSTLQPVPRQVAARAETGADNPVQETMRDSLPAEVALKTVPARRFYYVSQDESITQLLPRIRALAVRLNVNLVKSGGSADGPVTLLALPGEDLRLALPTRGAPQASGRYRLYNAAKFKCAWLHLVQGEGDAQAMMAGFRKDVEAAGYRLTGEYRLQQIPGDDTTVELQLGVE